jgi:hypothetical protein
MVTCFRLKQRASFVGIAFLSCLGSFQIGLDVMDYLFSLNDKVRAKDRPLTRLDPVHMCTAAMVIQSFKGCHSKTFLITVVVRELIYPLCLTIGLWMVS